MENKNIWLIPTDKPNRLWVNNLLQGKLELSNDVLISSNTAQNIYITNNEYIKDDNWYINSEGKLLQFTGRNVLGDEFKAPKVILTTDQDLIKDGVQAIDDEFLKWFVKNSSCESIKITEDSFFGYRPILKQETFEEVDIELSKVIQQLSYDGLSIKEINAFKNGVKWQQERMCSEVFEWLSSKDYLSDKIEFIQKEFEQLKKK